MSTYAVFGMTRARAVEMSRKKVPTWKKIDGKVNQLNEAEWWAEVQLAADKVMAGTQTTQLSDKFDAPSFAFEYLSLARATTDARGLHVKSYGKTGSTNPKTGKPIFEWKLVSEADQYRHSRSA